MEKAILNIASHFVASMNLTKSIPKGTLGSLPHHCHPWDIVGLYCRRLYEDGEPLGCFPWPSAQSFHTVLLLFYGSSYLSGEQCFFDMGLISAVTVMITVLTSFDNLYYSTVYSPVMAYRYSIHLHFGSSLPVFSPPLWSLQSVSSQVWNVSWKLKWDLWILLWNHICCTITQYKLKEQIKIKSSKPRANAVCQAGRIWKLSN